MNLEKLGESIDLRVLSKLKIYNTNNNIFYINTLNYNKNNNIQKPKNISNTNNNIFYMNIKKKPVQLIDFTHTVHVNNNLFFVF